MVSATLSEGFSVLYVIFTDRLYSSPARAIDLECVCGVRIILFELNDFHLDILHAGST